MSELSPALRYVLQEIMRDIPPSRWDKYVYDELQLWNYRMGGQLTSEDMKDMVKEVIKEEAAINSTRYKEYEKNGGEYVFNEEGEQVRGEAPRNMGFVSGGRLTGDQMVLNTEYGVVNTTTERVLSFRLFQQDVLRSTGALYESKHKLKHEQNLKYWLTVISKVERAEDDDTLPINIFKYYLEEWLLNAEVEPERFESAIRNKTRAFIKDGREYIFSPDALMNWLKVVDKERKWKKSEVKIFLQTIYGPHFDGNKRIFKEKYRVFSIMQTRDYDVPIAGESGDGDANPGEAQDSTQILNDSGSGEDHTAPDGHQADSDDGGTITGDSGAVILEDDGGRSEDPPASTDDVPF